MVSNPKYFARLRQIFCVATAILCQPDLKSSYWFILFPACLLLPENMYYNSGCSIRSKVSSKLYYSFLQARNNSYHVSVFICIDCHVSRKGPASVWESLIYGEHECAIILCFDGSHFCILSAPYFHAIKFNLSFVFGVTIQICQNRSDCKVFETDCMCIVYSNCTQSCTGHVIFFYRWS